MSKIALMPSPFGPRIKVISDADFADLVAGADFTNTTTNLKYTNISSKKYNGCFVHVLSVTISTPPPSPPPPPPSVKAP